MRRAAATFLFVLAALASGAADAPASPVAVPLARDQFVALLTRDFSSHFRLEGDLQLELLRAWNPPAGVASKWTLEVLEYPNQATSSMLVRCRLNADGAEAGEMTLVCKAAHWREVWVTRQPLEVGATFDPAVLDTRRVDVFRERDIVPTVAGDRSFVFSRAIAGGRLLTWHDLSRRPLVRKGELVEVSAVDGLLTITMKALALENGAQGDMVTVRNPDSRKEFSALVTDENRVQVHF
jgi:flagella basal body P-ring formation protein FlgA